MGVTESNIRDSLAACLHKLEPGLSFIEKEAKLPASIGTLGFVDLLAHDAERRYVLVEVKRTDAAAREAIHEILKYIENAKNYLGLRENELRVIIASVEWRELLVPFSSFVSRTTCDVQGYELEVDETGAVVSAELVEPLPIQSERVLAPWHELRFYKDEGALVAGIKSHEASNKARQLDSYALIILDAPLEHPDGFPSTKQITNRRILTELAQGMGQSAKAVPDELYTSAIYFSMQQLSRAEYVKCLPSGTQSTIDTLRYVEGLDEEDALAALHEAALDLEPRPKGDFFEIGYPAKFRGRLLDEEGWRIRTVQRYGAFQRNSLLSDETIVEEIGGSQGNSKQSAKLSFRPSQKAEVAEARRRVNDCLGENDPWRTQIHFCIDELVKANEDRSCYLQVYSPSSALTTIYLAASRDDGVLYIPTYQIRIPEDDTERVYYGALCHDGSAAPALRKVIDEFYEASPSLLLFTLQWGGYESRDVKILRRVGLRYTTFLSTRDELGQKFYRLDNHEWEESELVNPLSSFYTFLESQTDFTSEVVELYSSHWDGNVLALDGLD